MVALVYCQCKLSGIEASAYLETASFTAPERAVVLFGCVSGHGRLSLSSKDTRAFDIYIYTYLSTSLGKVCQQEKASWWEYFQVFKVWIRPVLGLLTGSRGFLKVVFRFFAICVHESLTRQAGMGSKESVTLLVGSSTSRTQPSQASSPSRKEWTRSLSRRRPVSRFAK